VLTEILGGRARVQLTASELELTGHEVEMLATVLRATREGPLSDTRRAPDLVLPPLDQLIPAPASSLRHLGPLGEALQLGSDVVERFGADRFLERADNTARALLCAVRLVIALTHLVGFRQLTGDEQLAGRDMTPSDLTLVALAHAHSALNRVAALDDQLADAQARLVEAQQQAQTLTDQLIQTRLKARQNLDQVAPISEELDEAITRIHSLEDDLSQRDRRNKMLAFTNQELRASLAQAQATSENAGMREDQLESLYRFLYQHGRMVSSADEFYQLLRAAVTNDPSAVPAGAWLNLVISPDDRPGAPPKTAMKDLAHYKPLVEAPVPEGRVPTVLTPAAASSPAKKRAMPLSPASSDAESSGTEVVPTKRSRRAAYDSVSAREARRVDDLEKKQVIDESFQQQAGDQFTPVDLADDSESVDSEASEDDSPTPDASPAPAESKPRKSPLKKKMSSKTTSSSGTSSSATRTGPTRGSASSSKATAKAKAKAKRAVAFAPTLATGPIAHHLSADSVEQCEAVPTCPKGGTLTGIDFPHVDIPFTLGRARGYSSTVPYTSATIRHLATVAGISTQRLSPPQSLFFPNYEVAKGKSAAVLANFGSDPYDQLETLRQAAPWDDMWRRRVRHFFLFDPNQLSKIQVRFFQRVWTFMFRFRQEYWTRNHWLAISREHRSDQLTDYYDDRQAADDAFTRGWRQLRDSAPAGLTLLMWSEPAFWFVPDRPCSWIPKSVDEVPILTQLEELDELEPIRSNWSAHPGRFVEALLPGQIGLLDSHEGKCWKVPGPWGRAKYQPPDEVSWLPPPRESSKARSSEI
jgi:hypothetical protein